MRRVALALVLLLGCGGARESAPFHAPARHVTSLRAFARLYGVVRWFHPSDEAAAADWNQRAIDGVAAMRQAYTRDDVKRALERWVAPISADIVIGSAAEVAKPPAALPAPPAGAKVELVAWQYTGPGFDGGADPYRGKRTARTGEALAQGSWGVFSQVIDATPLRGKRVQLRARMRAGRKTRVGAWLRVDRADGGLGFFDNMEDRPVTTPSWQVGTIEGDVASDATWVVIGGIVTGDEGWFDDFALDVATGTGGWSRVAIADADFASGAEAWSVGAASWELSADGRAGHLRAPRETLTEDLYAERPAAGETVTVDLGDGLWARVPIALTSVDGHTLPAVPRMAAVLGNANGDVQPGDALVADVVVAWNVYAHFYPYLDVIATDWHAYLDEALTAAVAANGDATKLHDVLNNVVVAAEDGHGFISSGAERAPLPAVLDLVEGKILVVVSGDPALQRGDEIVSIDGVAAGDALAAVQRRHSGSPQWATHMSLLSLGAGPEGSAAAVDVRRDGAVVSGVVKRAEPPAPYTYPPVGEVEPGVWLVDLSRADMAAIDAKMDALAAAKGIVFDMRGYPNSTSPVLNHLVDAPEHDLWMHVAHVIRPNLPGHPPPEEKWESFSWDLEPVAPRLRGKVVFLAGPGAISYAESVMGYVEAFGLPIVGGATAGTNGNIRAVVLPSGATYIFTGMKVTRHDGTRSHLEGIRPTVPVERTIAGVRAGRDEVLERGIALVR